MKKSILLILIILLTSWNSFSQNVTATNDTIKKPVHLTINQAKSAAKDIIRFDDCFKENILLYNQIELYKQKDTQKDSLIIGYKELNKNNKIIINNDSIQKELFVKNELLFKKQIRKEKTKKIFWLTTTIIASITTVIAIIK